MSKAKVFLVLLGCVTLAGGTAAARGRGGGGGGHWGGGGGHVGGSHGPAPAAHGGPIGGHPVAAPAARGFSETTVNRGGATFVQRSYTRGGATYTHLYTPYRWGGRPFYAYHPYYHYRPWFYGYCWHPWARPIAWGWGWGAYPWYGYYGYYFAPYPLYGGPVFWLTDFIIADYLAEQYAARLAAANAAAANPNAAPGGAGGTPISEDTKEQIRKQVEAEIKAHEQQKSVTLGELANDTQHLYPVSEEINASIGENQTCSLTEGDIVRLKKPIAEGDVTASMVVVTSKKDSCAAGSVIDISLRDLSMFQNDFSARVEKGMQKLQKDMPDGTKPEAPAEEEQEAPQPVPQPAPQPAPQP